MGEDRFLFWFGLVWLLIGVTIGAVTTNASIRNHMVCVAKGGVP